MYVYCVIIQYQVIPVLYIGSQKDAQDQEQIQRFRISHVVSCLQGATKGFKVRLTGFINSINSNPGPDLSAPTSIRQSPPEPD